MAGNNELETTGKTISEPWGPIQEPLQNLFGGAGNVYNQNMARFPGGQVPGRNVAGLGITTAPYYQGLLADTARAGGQALQSGAAENYLTGTAKGEYLNGSPHLEGVIQSAVDPAVNSLKSMYSAAGRGFSGAMDKDFVNTVGGIRSGILNQNYQAERDRQIGAANSIEGAQQGRQGLYQNALGLRQGVLNSYGDTQARQIALQPILDQLRTWDPRDDVNRQYAGILGSGAPYGTTETQEPPVPLWQQILGGVTGIAGLLGGFMGDQQGVNTPSGGILASRQPQRGYV